MSKFLHNIALIDESVAADGTRTFDLAVNPLSVLILVARPLNDTGVLANFSTYHNLMKCFEKVDIQFRGESIINMRGEDIAAYNLFRWGMVPWTSTPQNTDNDRLAVCLPIPLGRWPYSRSSCFPSSKRGELTCSVTIDVADTGYDNFRWSAESIELLDARPSEYEKRTQQSLTFLATGDNDVDLPIGNGVRGVFLFGTTGTTGAAPAPTLGRIKVLKDNQEYGFANTDFEVAHMLPSLWGRRPDFTSHSHTLDATVAGITNTQSVHSVQNDFRNYAHLDFDPTGDDEYIVETAGANRFHLRINAETADAMRAITCERVKV